MEVAFRMRKEAPAVFDITKEPEKVRERYGDTAVGRGCLMARRMVRIYHGNGQPWDNHDDIQIHRTLAREADPAIGSLIEDLRERDMLKETIVLAGGGFKGGVTYGATDDFGFKAIDKRVYAHDLQTTMLHQMGIDHTRLTDVGGTVIHDLLA